MKVFGALLYKPTRLGYPNTFISVAGLFLLGNILPPLFETPRVHHGWSYRVDSHAVIQRTAWYICGCWGMLPAGDPLVLLLSLTLTFSHDKELPLFSNLS